MSQSQEELVHTSFVADRKTLEKFDIIKGPYYTRSKYLKKLIDEKVADADKAAALSVAVTGELKEK
jgi:hypothetical protein